MESKNLKLFLSLLIYAAFYQGSFGQESVPLGIHYQAVARDNYGKEIANKDIDVIFSIISGSPVGTPVYQELHSKVITSKYGVFSLIIGHGTPTGGIYGELSQIKWSQAYHYLKVEVKFESTFLDMGTMQFLAVPYALFAQKSLEPGPQGVKGDIGPQGLQGVQGLKGDAGDPASDDQTLSFDGTNLSISIGNNGTPSTVNLATLNVPHSLSILGDTLSIMGGNKVELPNQIQDLHLDQNNILKIDKNITATEINLNRFLDDKQQLSLNTIENSLAISGGNSVDLSPLKQDLLLTGNSLTITNKQSPTQIDLSKYMQQLVFTPADNNLEIAGGNKIDLTSLKNDADADPENEIQDLSLAGNKLTITKKTTPTEINLAPYLDNTDNQALGYNPATYSLSLTNGGSVSLGSMIAFRAKKTVSISASQITELTFIPEIIPEADEYNDGNAFNRGNGEFIAPVTGIYTFSISYFADGSGSARKLLMYYNTGLYEEIAVEIAAGTLTTRSITMRLNATDVVKLKIYTGMATQTGTGSFSGFRVY
jgi:hypothetical protein